MYVDWLVETHYLRMFLQLSRIPHYTTLQKLAARINGTILAKIISSFIILTGTRHIFAGIDSTGFKVTHASEYYSWRSNLRSRRKYAKLSIGADLLQQIICNIRIRRAPTKHDNIDFKPIIKRVANIIPLSVVTADKAYDRRQPYFGKRRVRCIQCYSSTTQRCSNMEYTWKIQKTNEAWVSQNTVQSKEQG